MGFFMFILVELRSDNGTDDLRLKESLCLVCCWKDKTRTVQLEQVKDQCVHIIGMLGGSINHALVSRTNPAHLEKLAVAWDSHKHLRFDFPFQDVKPTIYFGEWFSVNFTLYFLLLLPLHYGYEYDLFYC